jgi:hypothetical protein
MAIDDPADDHRGFVALAGGRRLENPYERRRVLGMLAGDGASRRCDVGKAP